MHPTRNLLQRRYYGGRVAAFGLRGKSIMNEEPRLTSNESASRTLPIEPVAMTGRWERYQTINMQWRDESRSDC